MNIKTITLLSMKTMKADEEFLITIDGTDGRLGAIKIEDGKLSFEGDVHESAKVFFDCLLTIGEEWMKNRLFESHESIGNVEFED